MWSKFSNDLLTENLRSLNLLLVEYSRLLADATFSFKALSGITKIDISSYVDFYIDADRYSFRHYDILSA